jgi:hypothetical protein
MNALERQLDALLADPLQPARADGGAIGHVGADVPLDLLFATGRAVAHLPWVADRATPRADGWLESGFPGWARSILEDWAAGRFDCFAQVIFSRGNDSAQRLYYYVCELQRTGQIAGPEPLIFDVAYIPRESSLRHTQASLRQLAARLGVDTAALSAGIGRANRLRDAFAGLEAGRVSNGPLYGKLGRASLFADVAPLLAGHPLTPVTASAARCRVLLAGSAPPDERLHGAVEANGASIIAELHELAPARLGAVIDAAAADPFEAIARQRRAAPVGPRGFDDAARRLRETAQRARAQAVLLWLTQDDEALAWHVPAQRAALAEAGIPALVMTARRWDATDGATEEITAFLKGLPS